tara:strand:+ start:37 stop:192 length:156 start_codon:yes stop_codon:yes gene_type:complete
MHGFELLRSSERQEFSIDHDAWKKIEEKIINERHVIEERSRTKEKRRKKKE